MKLVVDANCFIDAVNPETTAYGSLQKIFKACDSGAIELMVSRNTLYELSMRTDAAFVLAQKLPTIPHWPIGAWGEQVAEWNQAAGTWNDSRRNNQIQQELKQLANSGNDIRDRGAYMDACMVNADAFVTSDKQLVGTGPAKRIEAKFSIRVITPTDLATEISD